MFKTKSYSLLVEVKLRMIQLKIVVKKNCPEPKLRDTWKIRNYEGYKSDHIFDLK